MKTEDLLTLQNWTKVIGNTKTITYFSGITGSNPSGNKNIESIIFKRSGIPFITQLFTYDADDDVIDINVVYHS